MQSSKAQVEPAGVLSVSFGNSHSLVPVQKEQMLISLVGAVSEAFVLRDEVSAAPGKRRSCCVTAPGGERKQEQHTVAWLLLAQLRSFFLLKLDSGALHKTKAPSG